MDIWRINRGWLGMVGPGLKQIPNSFRTMKINQRMSIDGIILTVASVFIFLGLEITEIFFWGHSELVKSPILFGKYTIVFWANSQFAICIFLNITGRGVNSGNLIP